MDDLLKWRDELPILKTTTYLISNSLGAMPRGVASALEEYARTWATRGVRAWEEGWWEMGVTVGDEIAPIVGADPASRVGGRLSAISKRRAPQGLRGGRPRPRPAGG